jgi:putative SOS response-associated peptidase YedK
VVTDGFYEWKKLTAKEKQPYAIAAKKGMMIMAGLWSRWKDPKSGGEVLSCTILTCRPNQVPAELHDRMPAILAESDWPKWLGEVPATTEEELLALLKPYPDNALKI